jgi:hypothetical protein
MIWQCKPIKFVRVVPRYIKTARAIAGLKLQQEAGTHGIIIDVNKMVPFCEYYFLGSCRNLHRTFYFVGYCDLTFCYMLSIIAFQSPYIIYYFAILSNSKPETYIEISARGRLGLLFNIFVDTYLNITPAKFIEYNFMKFINSYKRQQYSLILTIDMIFASMSFNVGEQSRINI